MKTHFFGESAGNSLAAWLNNPATDEQQQKKVLELVTAGEELQKKQSVAARQEMKDKINQILVGLRFYPQLISHARGGPFVLLWEANDLGEDNPSIAGVVRHWLELVNLGQLHRFRKCSLPSCSKFFFSTTNGSFDSPECRMLAGRQNERRREARRVYARNYRKNLHKVRGA